MKRLIRDLLLVIGILTAVAGALLFVSRILMSTDHISGTDEDTKDSVRYEPLRRHYIKLNLPE